jgi:hypothetical protein
MDAVPAEVPLSDGGTTVAGSVLVEGRVHRRAGEWTDAVQALLAHLAAVGFSGAPRPVGFDDRGREVVSFVDGDAPAQPWPAWMCTDGALAGVANLLRAYHDAVEGFVAPPGARWRAWLGSPGGPLIRHGDLWPSNVVFREGMPVALIDWDFAQPGSRLDDLASLAKHWVPLMSDERAAGDGWRLPVDRRHRLRVMCDAYGLAIGEWQQLLPTVVRNATYGYASHKAWGEAGVPGFKEMWEGGSGDVILADRAWLEEARPALEAFAVE